VNKPKVKALLVVALSACLLSACGEEHGDLQSWMESVGQSQRGKIPPLPAIKPYSPVSYDVASKMDPFDMAKLEPDDKTIYGQGEGAPDFDAREARNNVMERYPLEAMHMIGYLKIENQPMAAIFVDRITKQVKVGDWIGLDFGQVKKVTDQEVELEETLQDSNGKWNKRTNSLQMQAGKGG